MTPHRDHAMARPAGPGEPDAAPVLELTALSVSFGGVHALSDISMQVGPAEVVALIGPNGAGKSTLLNAVSGLIRANVSGRITLAGRPVARRHPATIAGLGVGRSFQHPPLLDTESVLENLMLGAHLRLRYRMTDQLVRRGRVRRQEAAERERALRLLETVGLAGDAGREAGALPYGGRKLVDILRALMAEPRLLLLDEPTSGLDARERAVVEGLLQSIRDAGQMSVLLVEHHMDVVRKLADSVVGLQAGTVLRTGTPHEVLDSEVFRNAVVGTDGPPMTARAGEGS
jgi:branched-chain amino acid transport system ATP-binding protein